VIPPFAQEAKEPVPQNIDTVDVNGNSWLSKLWDHTVLRWNQLINHALESTRIGRDIAINWDHQGRVAAEMVAVVVASYFGGEALASAIYTPASASVAATTTADVAAGQIGAMTVTAESGALADAVDASAISAGTATTIATVAGGAAGGFIGGTVSAAFAGENLGQSLQSGGVSALEAAAFAFAGNELLHFQTTAPSMAGARNAVITAAARDGVNAFAEKQLGINGWEFDAGLEAISYLGYKAFGDPYNYTDPNHSNLGEYIGGFSHRDPSTGWLFQGQNQETEHTIGEFLFDANDQMLNYQGLLDAGGIAYSYHGWSLPSTGFSLGASRINTLAALGIVGGGVAAALPIGEAATGGLQPILGTGDLVNGSVLGFILNTQAAPISVPFVTGHQYPLYYPSTVGQ
jgi:hypothetical protein